MVSTSAAPIIQVTEPGATKSVANSSSFVVKGTVKTAADIVNIKAYKNSEESETASDCGDFSVNGLWFNRSGVCCSPILTITQSGDGMSSSNTQYFYDEDGRMVGHDSGSTKATIEYNGKVQTTTYEIKSSVNGMTTTMTQVYEYK